MITTARRGAVAAGHTATAEAAAFALREGGNAFDAAIAAHWCACVAEPVLTSLGGGGFLLAHPAGAAPRLFDFFAHTPRVRRPADETEFRPIHADFGTTLQEFHIGYGSVATPGTVRGLFAIHRELGTLPMKVLTHPALELARNGVRVNALQAYIFDVVRPVCLSTAAAAQRFASARDTGRLVGEGEILRLPELGETLEALAEEGDRLFYEGDIAALIDRACRDGGGHLDRHDLHAYRVTLRKPLRVTYRDAVLLTNPPPASGGLLIGFALKLLERLGATGEGMHNVQALAQLAAVMRCTNEARLRAQAANLLDERLLDPGLLQQYIDRVQQRSRAYRGTTHISIIDNAGNIAALTTSNGEGCGHMLGDTGIMLNNMLGEEDLNPGGFHQWRPDQRLTSMMSPSLLQMADHTLVALGSGGSNRIRSAILQVLLRLVDEQLPLEEAICLPRIHYEDDLLSVESGFEPRVYQQLEKAFDNVRCWPDRNLFFGGVHAVSSKGGRFECSGDPRRGGVALRV